MSLSITTTADGIKLLSIQLLLDYNLWCIQCPASGTGRTLGNGWRSSTKQVCWIIGSGISSKLVTFLCFSHGCSEQRTRTNRQQVSCIVPRTSWTASGSAKWVPSSIRWHPFFSTLGGYLAPLQRSSTHLANEDRQG